MDDADILAMVTRLSRPHRSGGNVIERAAIMAEGSGSADVLAWIARHDGEPEEQAAAAPRRGLHSERMTRAAAGSSTPQRYVLPPGALSA
jgi:hypothetical protein